MSIPKLPTAIVIENRSFVYPDDLFNEDEFNRLVSFSKSLPSTSSFEGSTIEGIDLKEPLPQTFGKYQLTRLLGDGRIGKTYLARHADSSNEFAVTKICPEHVERLGAEWITSRLDQLHRDSLAASAVFAENVTAVFEVGGIDGTYFYSTRHIYGKSLAKSVNSKTASNRDAALVVKAIAESVHQLHKVGVFHRDLRPANIMLDRDSKPYILPGSAVLKADEDRDSFRAAEVANRSAINAVAEIWSLGAILYNCLVGEPPSIASVVPPRKKNPKVARDLETICLKCLRKNPGQRYSNAAALADDLDRFLDHQPIDAAPYGLVGKLINKLTKMG